MRNDQDEYGRDATILGNDMPRVAPLSDLDDFQVADGCPDVRGWDVVGPDGRKVGTVHELIADTGAMRVRYLDVQLDHSAAGSQGDRDVLVPIGTARLDENDDRVMIDAATASRIGTLPAYTHGQVTREHENRVLPALGITAAGAGADFYAGKHFDDGQFYAGRRAPRADESRHLTRSEDELEIGKREVRAGEVVVRKPVESEHVKRPVNEARQVEADLRKERIDVDRGRGRDDRSRDAR